MKGLRLALFSLNLALLVGCASTPPKAVKLQHLPDVPDGYANVYFMREPANLGDRAWPAVLLNGQRAALLPQGTFSVVAVKAGLYAVTMEKEQLFSFRWTGATQITVEAGQTYYLRLEVKDRVVTSYIPADRSTCTGSKDCGTEALDFDESAGQSWNVVDTKTALVELQYLLYVEPINARLP